jgi:hypothetical protein
MIYHLCKAHKGLGHPRGVVCGGGGVGGWLGVVCVCVFGGGGGGHDCLEPSIGA